MQPARTILIFLALALVGFADALYLGVSRYTSNPLLCDMLDGCNIVAFSPYAELFGVPFSYAGILFYLIALVGALLALKDAKRYAPALLHITALGALMSAYFTFVQFALIEAVCIYCLISAGITWMLFALSIVYWRHQRMLGDGNSSVREYNGKRR